MMGTTVDIRKTIDSIHDAPVKTLVSDMAEILISQGEFDALAILDSIAREYEKISRKNFGYVQTISKLREQNDKYLRSIAGV